MTKLVRGRPERNPIELYRTKLWVQSVCVTAHCSAEDLERVLGPDGKWEGLWSRYVRGAVTPTLDRRMRIESRLPGTERYYSSSLWMLAENREFSWSELRGLVNGLQKLFRDGFVEDGRSISAKGKFWRSDFDRGGLLNTASLMVADQKYGLDALTTILLLLREAELLQDGELYLHALRECAFAAEHKNEHIILQAIPKRFFASIVEPLRRMRFADSALDKSVTNRFAAYSYHYKATRSSCDLLGALRYFATFGS